MLKKGFVFWTLSVTAVFLMTTPVLAQKVRGVTDTEILIGQTGP
jgi:hypothetical protein